MNTNNFPFEWNPAKRVLFRFAFVYLILYMVPFLVMIVPPSETILQPYGDAWNAVVRWVGPHVFQVEITDPSYFSGDTIANFVYQFCLLVLSLAAAIAWTLLDRKRSSYAELHEGLRVGVRFFLAAIMIIYGAVKVIKSQFPNPSLDALAQPLGETSPMGLLWTFMGASESYNIFTGAAEILGGLLLTCRRTTLLGALVCIGALSNVVMLNFGYDVYVKLYSLHLLAMAVFLTIPDLPRLANFFLRNRPVVPADLIPLVRTTWLHRGALLLRTALVVYFVGWALWDSQKSRKIMGDLTPRSPLYGIWNVEEFTVDGKARPPLLTDTTRWRRVIFDQPHILAVHLMNDERQYFLLELNARWHSLALSQPQDPTSKSTLTFRRPVPDQLLLEGTLDGRKFRARLRSASAEQYQAVNRGFRWINERTYNR